MKYRNMQCMSCGKQWTALSRKFAYCTTLSGEMIPQCPKCYTRNVCCGPEYNSTRFVLCLRTQWWSILNRWCCNPVYGPRWFRSQESAERFIEKLQHQRDSWGETIPRPDIVVDYNWLENYVK